MSFALRTHSCTMLGSRGAMMTLGGSVCSCKPYCSTLTWRGEECKLGFEPCLCFWGTLICADCFCGTFICAELDGVS